MMNTTGGVDVEDGPRDFGVIVTGVGRTRTTMGEVTAAVEPV